MQEIIIPRMKPAAYDTWEIRDSLDADTLETSRLAIEFPEPYMVVGMHVSVIAVTNTVDLVIPTAEDFLALMDVDNQRLYTSARVIGQTASAARGQQYVTLASLDTRYRDLHMKMESPKPVLGMSFRWKIFDDATRETLYQNADIAVSLFCCPLKG